MKMNKLEMILELRLPQFRTIAVGLTTDTTRRFRVKMMTPTASHIWLPTIYRVLKENNLKDIVCTSVSYSTTHEGNTQTEIVLSIELYFNMREGESLTI